MVAHGSASKWASFWKPFNGGIADEILFLEIEDLIELGTETKKARRSPAPKNEPDSTEKLTAVPNIKPPILPSTLVEDESHFLLSRTIIDQSESTTSKKPQVAQTATSTDIKKLPKTNCNEKENEPLK